MKEENIQEKQAKEALQTASIGQYLKDWDDFINLPPLYQAKSKEKSIEARLRLPTRRTISSSSNYKPCLIPSKPIFQEKANSIKNGLKSKPP